MKLNYRNSKQILEFAYRFAEEFIGAKDSDDDHIPIISPEATGTTGPDPVFKQLDNEAAEVEYIVHCIRHWLEKGHQLEEIGILVPDMILGKRVSRALNAEQVPNLCMADRADKYSYDPLRPRVSILSIYAVKAWSSKRSLFWASIKLVGE